MSLNDELHATKATDKAALEAAAQQLEALLASQGIERSPKHMMDGWVAAAGGADECEGSALQRRAWVAFCDGIMVARHVSALERAHQDKVSKLQLQLRRARRAGYAKKTQTEWEYGGPNFDELSDSDMSQQLDDDVVGPRLQIITPPPMPDHHSIDGTNTLIDKLRWNIYDHVLGGASDSDDGGAERPQGFADEESSDMDSDEEEINAEMRARGLVVMGRKQQMQLFQQLTLTLSRDRRQFRCIVHCFQAWRGWWEGQVHLAQLADQVKVSQAKRLRQAVLRLWRTQAAQQWLSSRADTSIASQHVGTSVGMTSPLYMHAQDGINAGTVWELARAHRSLQAHEHAEATAAEHNALLVLGVLNSMERRRNAAAVHSAFRAWHFHWQKWLESANLTATVEQLQEQHAQELRDLEFHHTLAGASVATQGEALLMQQKLVASRDKMMMQQVIFARARRVRAAEVRECFLSWAMHVQKELRHRADERATARLQEAQNRVDRAASALFAPLQNTAVAHGLLRRSLRMLGGAFVHWSEWFRQRRRHRNLLQRSRGSCGSMVRPKLTRAFQAWILHYYTAPLIGRCASLTEQVANLTEHLSSAGVRMQLLAKKKLSTSRLFTMVPTIFKEWAVWARAKGNYRRFAEGTLLRYALRSRVKCFRQWVVFTREVVTARQKLEDTLSRSEKAGMRIGSALSQRSWESRCEGVVTRVKRQLTDLVIEAHAYRQAVHLVGAWDGPLTPVRNLHGSWSIVANPQEIDDDSAYRTKAAATAGARLTGSKGSMSGQEVRHALRTGYTSGVSTPPLHREANSPGVIRSTSGSGSATKRSPARRGQAENRSGRRYVDGDGAAAGGGGEEIVHESLVLVPEAVVPNEMPRNEQKQYVSTSSPSPAAGLRTGKSPTRMGRKRSPRRVATDARKDEQQQKTTVKVGTDAVEVDGVVRCTFQLWIG